MTKLEELREQAIEMLENDDELFVRCVEELDNYSGFADGFRCYPMDEIDDYFYGVSIGDFLDKITDDFNHRDNYFVDTIYGLESTDYPEDVYRDNTSEDEVLDELIDEFPNVNVRWISDDFQDLLEQIVNTDDDDEDDEEEETEEV